MGLFNLMGTGGREIQKHTAMELLDIVTTAIIGALYIDGGTESVTCVLGGYVDCTAKRRRSSLQLCITSCTFIRVKLEYLYLPARTTPYPRATRVKVLLV